jgi:hypothetical protein
MVASVGRNTPDILATKRAYFAQYTASGEFNYTGSSPSPAPAPPAPPAVDLAGAIATFTSAASRLQGGLLDAGFYTGKIDGDWGPQSRAALAAYKARTK